MKPIGGYFSLELSKGEPFHPNAVALNTGRNSFEYVLRCRNYSKVYIPYYTCGVLLEPLRKLSVPYDFYHINKQLELSNVVSLENDEALLYINYFGLKNKYVEHLACLYGKQLIIDNTQAFFAQPVEGIDTFYTCRKFFGVPDGAYLYTDAKGDFDIERDVSFDRMSFLLKRLDLGAEAGYADFREQSARLEGQPIKLMSCLTSQMMCGIDYQSVCQIRRTNYRYLHHHLAASNLLPLEFDENAVPLVYPYLTNDKTLKQKLIAKKIYVATYWPNVSEWCKPEDWEYVLTAQTAFIPIDQRYGLDDMRRIIELIMTPETISL